MMTEDNAMFEISDVIMYGLYGICEITDIQNKNFGNCGSSLYYVMHPISDERTTLYAPVESNKISLRRLLHTEDVLELIESLPGEDLDWIENDQLRHKAFCKIIKNGNYTDQFRVLVALYKHREEKKKQNKKFFIADEKLLHDTEKLLYEELAYVLHIDRDEVCSRVMNKMNIEVS